jgi:hypothetical protein
MGGASIIVAMTRFGSGLSCDTVPLCHICVGCFAAPYYPNIIFYDPSASGNFSPANDSAVAFDQC